MISYLRAWWNCRSSLAVLAEWAALRAPHRIALEDEQGCLTYAQLLGKMHRLALRLQDLGLRPGGRVALMCPNGREFVLGLLACLRLGAEVLPLDPATPELRLQKLLQLQGIQQVLRPEDLSCAEASFQGRLPGLKSPGQLIVLTSGTTGVAKGVRRRPTLWQLLPLTVGLLRGLPLRPCSPMALAIPLFHGYGLAALAMALFLLDPLVLARRLDIGPLLRRCPGAFLISVPTLLRRWLQQPQLEPVRAILTGSAPLAPELCLELLERCGPCLYNLYGTSEAGVIALASPKDLQAAPGCVGFALPGNRIRLDSSPGPIRVQGPLVVGAGPQGWYFTGDLGRLDEQGRLHVCGRADSMFVSGGENVYPHEIEEVVCSHPEVAEALVLVVKDDDFGQRAVVVVRPEAHDTLDEKELRMWTEARLERCKRPRNYYLLPELPLNALGKIDRPRLVQTLGLTTGGPA